MVTFFSPPSQPLPYYLRQSQASNDLTSPSIDVTPHDPLPSSQTMVDTVQNPDPEQFSQSHHPIIGYLDTTLKWIINLQLAKLSITSQTHYAVIRSFFSFMQLCLVCSIFFYTSIDAKIKSATALFVAFSLMNIVLDIFLQISTLNCHNQTQTPCTISKALDMSYTYLILFTAAIINLTIHKQTIQDYYQKFKNHMMLTDSNTQPIHLTIPY